MGPDPTTSNGAPSDDASDDASADPGDDTSDDAGDDRIDDGSTIEPPRSDAASNDAVDTDAYESDGSPGEDAGDDPAPGEDDASARPDSFVDASEAGELGAPLGARCGPTRPRCAAGLYCAANPTSCAFDARAKCALAPTACARELAPACGCDGKVYDNACLAALAGVSVARTPLCDAGAPAD